MVAGQELVLLDRRQRGEADLVALDHRDRDHAIEREHEVRRDALQQRVQSEDLRPVGLRGESARMPSYLASADRNL